MVVVELVWDQGHLHLQVTTGQGKFNAWKHQSPMQGMQPCFMEDLQPGSTDLQIARAQHLGLVINLVSPLNLYILKVYHCNTTLIVHDITSAAHHDATLLACHLDAVVHHSIALVPLHLLAILILCHHLTVLVPHCNLTLHNHSPCSSPHIMR